jgi:hypothetical protein
MAKQPVPGMAMMMEASAMRPHAAIRAIAVEGHVGVGIVVASSQWCWFLTWQWRTIQGDCDRRYQDPTPHCGILSQAMTRSSARLLSFSRIVSRRRVSLYALDAPLAQLAADSSVSTVKAAWDGGGKIGIIGTN